jgi:hypothetical protein
VRGGHRLEGTATRRHFRLVFPEMYTSGVSRQEEQAQLPQGYGSDVLFSTSAPPTAAKVSGCPTLDSVTARYRSLETACQEGCESFSPSRSAVSGYRCRCFAEAKRCFAAPMHMLRSGETPFRGTDARASLGRNAVSGYRCTCFAQAKHCFGVPMHVLRSGETLLRGTDARASLGRNSASRTAHFVTNGSRVSTWKAVK